MNYNCVMSDTQELLKNLPDLDLKQYNHWRDWLKHLALGDTRLPKKSEDSSSEIGSYGHTLGQRTISNLREDRLDKNNNPYILCEDEVPDQDVLIGASREDIQKSFMRSFISESQRRSMETLSRRAKNYAAMSIALGSALLVTDQEETKDLLLSAIANYLPNKDLGRTLENAIKNASPDEIKQLTNYLKFSQTQLTLKEDYFLKTGLKEQPLIGSEPLTIDGKKYTFQNNKQNSGERLSAVLTPEDEEFLIPLKTANHRSREDMIEQAKILTEQIFDTQVKENYKPPSWWTNRLNLKTIKSNELLILLPHLPEEKYDNAPHLFQVIQRIAGDKRGWMLVQIESKNNEPLYIGRVASMVS